MAKLILFDCDGVLIDSEVIAGEVAAEMLTKHGLPYTLENILHKFLGLSSASANAILEKEFGGPLPQAFKEEYTVRLADVYRQHLKAMPGIFELLKGITVPVCVASSGSIKRLEFSLRHTGLYEYFSPNIFSAEMVAHGKPAPDLFLYAARQMGFPPYDCIVIEDSVNGVRAACNAEMACLGYVGGSHCNAVHANLLYEAGVKKVVNSMNDLALLLTDAIQQSPKST